MPAFQNDFLILRKISLYQVMLKVFPPVFRFWPVDLAVNNRIIKGVKQD